MKPKSKPKQKSKPQLTLVRKSFKATLERLRSNLGWVVIRIPFNVQKIWGTRGMFRVKGEINGFAFRTSLFPTRKGEHFLLVNKKMQAGAHATEGTTAEFLPGTRHRRARHHSFPSNSSAFSPKTARSRRWFDCAELFHSQVDFRLDRAAQKPRRPRPPRRASRRTASLRHGSRARTPARAEAGFHARSSCPRRLESHVAIAAPRPTHRHLLLPLARCTRSPHRQSSR